MRFIIAIMIIIVLVGCGSGKTINGEYYDTVGIFTGKEEGIKYQVVVGNVVWSVILSESLVFPVCFIGFALWEPVGLK